MSKTVAVDITVFGAGIAGLWLTATLIKQGYSVALLESHTIGGIQTIASQGIIHGGTKYALMGNLSESARAIGEMPHIWRSCLAGKGMIDLTKVRILSDHQHLWSTAKLTSQLSGFFASKLMRSRIFPVNPSAYPTPFDSTEFNGKLYQLNEPVLDIPSLIKELTDQIRPHVILARPEQVSLNPAEPNSLCYQHGDEEITLTSKRTILAAGAGNRAILERLGKDLPAMQLRPLHMLMMKGELPLLFAHCLDAKTNPRLTITSYPISSSESIWYIGGQLAEKGINCPEDELIDIAQKELHETMPWCNFDDICWHSFRVDRAEQKNKQGRRPDSYSISDNQGIITLWPTKLAFAPRLAADVVQLLQSQDVQPSAQQPEQLQHLPQPALAKPPWEMFER